MVSTGGLSRAPTAPSSVDSSNSWRHHSWTTSTPSTSCSESGDNIPSFPPFNRPMQVNPYTPPDSAFGSYTEKYQPASPYHRDLATFLTGAHSGHDVLADSGVGSIEPTRPSSPSPSPTTTGPQYRPGSKHNYRATSPDTQRGPGAEGRSATCTNCFTQTTPLWRINPEGQLLCNACGLFFRLHGVVRPPSLKTDLIKKRNCGGEDISAFPGQRSYDLVSEKRFCGPRTFAKPWFGASN